MPKQFIVLLSFILLISSCDRDVPPTATGEIMPVCTGITVTHESGTILGDLGRPSNNLGVIPGEGRNRARIRTLPNPCINSCLFMFTLDNADDVLIWAEKCSPDSDLIKHMPIGSYLYYQPYGCGKRILWDGFLTAGDHSIVFNFSDESFYHQTGFYRIYARIAEDLLWIDLLHMNVSDRDYFNNYFSYRRQ